MYSKVSKKVYDNVNVNYYKIVNILCYLWQNIIYKRAINQLCYWKEWCAREDFLR